MNRTQRVLCACAFILLQATIIVGQSRTNVIFPDRNPFTELLPADFCEILRKPHHYDGRIIRLRVILRMNHHGGWVTSYEPNTCGGGMRLGIECSNDIECRELDNKMRESFGGPAMGEGALLVSGRYRHRKLLTYREVRLGLSAHEFHVTKVEEVLKLPR